MGPLAFSGGSHHLTEGRNLAISDQSEASLAQILSDKKYPYVESPFDAGEISFHYGWTFHRAGANQSAAPRAVMTVIYFEDGARVIPPANENQERDLAQWLPGVKVGDVAASEMNPVLFKNRLS